MTTKSPHDYIVGRENENKEYVMFLFVTGVAVGAIGVVYMVQGARAIARNDVVSMATSHLSGVLYLSVSALITFITIGDGSYVLMQTPFLIGASKTWAEKTRRIRERDWWSVTRASTLNIVLIVSGIVVGIIASGPTMLQVLGAAIISSSLAMKDRLSMLTFLITGRLGMFVASTWKFSIDPTNAAALVWMGLMGWAIVDNSFQLKKVYSQ